MKEDFSVPSLVAVYGSLKKGFGNHRILENSKMLFEGFVEIPFCMVSLGAFPGLVKQKEVNPIFVEVYEVDSKETAFRLDRLEGYPHFYNRTKIGTPAGDAYIYYLNGEEEERSISDHIISSGVWKH